jgi:hypothetical protein
MKYRIQFISSEIDIDFHTDERLEAEILFLQFFNSSPFFHDCKCFHVILFENKTKIKKLTIEKGKQPVILENNG